MTKKRFKAKLDECGVYYYVCENGEILAETYGRDDAEDIAKRLNELFDENEQLKYTLSAYMVDLNNCKGECSALEIENEQLKKEKKQLQIKANEFVELYERDFGKTYHTPPRHGKTVRIQLWIVRKILDELGILELYGDVE